MKPTETFRALAYPLVTPAVGIPLLVFWLLLALALLGGLLGLFLLFLVIPAVVRFLMTVLEARARDAEPATPDVEYFNWFGKAWTLFPVPIVALLAWLVVAAGRHAGAAAGIVALLASSAFLPASLAVLAITRSPLQSLNPVAIGRLIGACGATLWIASIFLLLAGWLVVLGGGLPVAAHLLVVLVLSFSFVSLLGSLIAPQGLVDNVDIPAPLAADDAQLAAGVEKERLAVLNHAYGFMSRGNRDGGLRHIAERIGAEADPVVAWAWFFEQILRWEQQDHALYFAQHYLRDLLRRGEEIPALKLLQRCRRVDERFRPFPEDTAALVAVAERHGNAELAAVLKRI